MEPIKYGRKKSGIRKELTEKINEWIATITDEKVRDAATKDTIVTGGSIASMLMGDPINDYDVYFRTKDTAILVAKYYVDRFIENRKTNNIVGYDPLVREDRVLNCKGEYEDRVCIYMQSAGVAAEGQTAYQYFEQVSEDATHAFGESLKPENENKKVYRPVFLSQNAITLTDKLQIVIRFYGEPEQIHDNYDFIHAMNYYDHKEQELVLKLEALEAILSRTLVYRGSLYPIASIFRTKKFLERGWRISAGQQLKIMWQISELDLKSFDVVKEQLTGVDQAYLHQLVESLTNVDPEKINSSYVATIIDRIFSE